MREVGTGQWLVWDVTSLMRVWVSGAAANEGVNLTGGGRDMVFENWFRCLLPVPANGDWDDLNTGAATDAWVGNHCMDGLAVARPT